MNLSYEELSFLMELIRLRFGSGYSQHPGVGPLQAKLSIMSEVAMKFDYRTKPIDIPTAKTT